MIPVKKHERWKLSEDWKDTANLLRYDKLHFPHREAKKRNSLSHWMLITPCGKHFISMSNTLWGFLVPSPLRQLLFRLTNVTCGTVRRHPPTFFHRYIFQLKTIQSLCHFLELGLSSP